MNELNDNIKILGEVILRAYRAGTKELLQEIRSKNTIVINPNRGIDLIVQRLIGSNTYSLNITHGDIGTGSTTPASTDTQLTTPYARVSTTYAAENGNNIAILQFFFPDSALSNQTYYEFGTFVDGTSTISTGQMFNHVLFSSPYAKTSGVDTT